MVQFNERKQTEVQAHKSIFTAKTMWESTKDLLYCNGLFYIWGGQVYKKVDDIDWLIMMSEKFPSFDEFSPQKQEEVLKVYKRFAKVDADKFNAEDGLCFKNKYLNLKDLSVHEHSQERINTILLPYEYNIDAKCPLWEKTIAEILQDDTYKIKCIQEFFGYCLTRDVFHEKSLLCIGESRTGKSTVLNVLSSMVGDQNVSALSLRYFKDSVRLHEIENKLIVMSHEVPKRIEDYEAEFRTIVSGQPIGVNPKYITPYNIKPFCKVVLAMNELPRIDDHSKAFYERLLHIEFNREFKKDERNKNLQFELKEELSGILNWALEGLKRLRENNEFTEDDSMDERINEIRLNNNPIAYWVKDNVKISDKKEDYLIKNDVYKKYTVWCGINGHRPAGMAKFSTDFYRIFRSVTFINKRESKGDDRKYIWPNLTWTTESPEPAQEVAQWED